MPPRSQARKNGPNGPSLLPSLFPGCRRESDVLSSKNDGSALFLLFTMKVPKALPRFILLYAAMYAAYGVASPFLPAFVSERGLHPAPSTRKSARKGSGSWQPSARSRCR